METYRLNVARLTFREEICLLPHGVRGFLSRRFGAARQAGTRFPIVLLPGPTPLRLSEARGPDGSLPAKLAHTVAQARQLGFKEPLAFLVGHPLPGCSGAPLLSGTPRPTILMRHASGNAVARFHAFDRPDGLISATFLTPLVDRNAVMTTTDRRATALLPPGIIPFAHPELQPQPHAHRDPLPLRLLWEEHKRSVAAQPVAAPAPLANSEELVEFCNALERRIFAWRDSGRDLLIPLNEQESALLAARAETARREQRRLRRGGLESALAFATLCSAFGPSPQNPGDSSPEAPLDPVGLAAASTHGFTRTVHRPLRQGGWLDAAFAAAAIFLFFAFARLESWHDPALWFACGAGFLLHGLGHAAGWRRVRRREAAARASAMPPRKPLFRHLPALPDDDTPFDSSGPRRAPGRDLAWSRAVAILLGPLPGLIAGCALLTGSVLAPLPLLPWLPLWGGVLLGLNLLTLLPLPFLDGGRLLRLLLFGRFPWLAPTLRACFVVALAALSLALQSLFLGMLALLVAATLPYHCRVASLGRRALHCFSKTEERLARRGPRAALALPPTSFIPFAAPVIAIVRQVRERLPHLVTPERVSRVAHRLCETALLRPRRARTTVAGLAIYTFALLLPLLPALCYLFQGRQMAELALIGGAYQRPRDPVDDTTRGVPVYIGMEEEAIIEEANGTRTPFPDDGTPRPQPSPRSTSRPEDKEPRGPKLTPADSWIEEAFPSWN